MAPNENGYFGHEWDPPVAGLRLIRAGNDDRFVRPVYPEDRITVIWSLQVPR